MKEMVAAAAAMLLAFFIVSGGFSVYRNIAEHDAVFAEEEAIEEYASDNMDQPAEAEEEVAADAGEEADASLYGEDAEDSLEEAPYRTCFEFMAMMRPADCGADHVKHSLLYDAGAVLSGDRLSFGELRKACEEYAALQAVGRSFDGTKDLSVIQYRIAGRNAYVNPQLMIWITSFFSAGQTFFSTFLELEYDPGDRNVKLCYIGGGSGTDAVMANAEGIIRETYPEGAVGEYARFYRYFYADGSGTLPYLYAVGLQDAGISAEEAARIGGPLYLASYFMERSRSIGSYADPDRAGLHALHRMPEGSGDPTLQYEPDYLSGLQADSSAAMDGIELCGPGDVIRRLMNKLDGLDIPAHALTAEERTRRFYEGASFGLYRALKTVRILPPAEIGPAK